MADEFVLLKDLPTSLLQTAAGDLAKFFTIAFVDVQEVANGPADAKLLGSGTLVSAGKTRAILTAHHVLQVLPRTGRLCILLEKAPAPHTIDLGGVSFVDIARGSNDSVGPDLAALVLAPSIAGALGSKRLFYNLDSQRERSLRDPLEPSDGPWLLQGWLDERTVVTKDPVRKEVTTAFYNFTGLGGVEVAPSVGGFDYLEYPVPIEAKTVAPRSWGGVSGGGLWQVFLNRKQGRLAVKSALLSGVAFYQHPASGGNYTVRCHGLRSIYQIAYDRIAGVRI